MKYMIGQNHVFRFILKAYIIEKRSELKYVWNI